MKQNTASQWERETQDLTKKRLRITQQFVAFQPQKGTSTDRAALNAASSTDRADKASGMNSDSIAPGTAARDLRSEVCKHYR